jgi:A/G-specific adenine glycosylase
VHGQGQPGAAAKRDLDDMEAILPESIAGAVRANVSIMELGALLCTARSPRCDVCPIAAQCAWRASGYPEFTGTRAPVQKRFAGSDRQVRGLIMAELRASDTRVTAGQVRTLWAIDEQRERALAGLLADGLVVAVGGGFELPT